MKIHGRFFVLGLKLIADDAGKFFGLGDPIRNHLLGWRAANKFLGFVHFEHFLEKVSRYTFGEFDNRIHTSFFKQVGIFLTNTLDAIKIRVI